MSDMGIDQCGGEAGGMYTREDLIREVERLREDKRNLGIAYERTIARERAEVERLRAMVRSRTDDFDATVTALQREHVEVERLRGDLELMTLYRDNAMALYRSANVRAYLHGDRSTHPDELKETE